MKLSFRFAAVYLVIRLVVSWKSFIDFPIKERFGFPDVWIEVGFLLLETCVVTVLFWLLSRAVLRIRRRDGHSS